MNMNQNLESNMHIFNMEGQIKLISFSFLT
jgi:hypothetical protein